MSADQFQTLALAWIGSAVAIASALIYGVAKVAPLIANVQELFRLHASNSSRITTNSTNLTNLAAQVTPTVVSQPLVTDATPLLIRQSTMFPVQPSVAPTLTVQPKAGMGMGEPSQ